MFDISPSEEVGDFEVKAKFMGVEMEKVQLHFQVNVSQVSEFHDSSSQRSASVTDGQISCFRHQTTDRNCGNDGAAFQRIPSVAKVDDEALHLDRHLNKHSRLLLRVMVDKMKSFPLQFYFSCFFCAGPPSAPV